MNRFQPFVPTGWTTVQLDSLVRQGDKINYGVVQPGGDFESGKPLIRVRDVVSGKILLDEMKTIDPDIEAKYSRSRLVGDEILVGCVGSIGAIALVQLEHRGFNIARAVSRIPINQTKVFRKYLMWYLRSDFVQRFFRSEIRVVAQPTLNIRQLKETPITLPPLPEQRRIAAILDKADAIRRKRQEAIELTEALLRSAFLEMFGDPGNVGPSKLVGLGTLVSPDDRANYGVVQPGQEVANGAPFIRVSDMKRGRIDRSAVKRIDPAIDQQYSRSKLRGDEVLLACVGHTIGKVAVADRAIAGWNIARAITRIPLRDQRLCVYVAEYLRTPYIQAWMRAEARTVGQPTLNVKQVKELPLVVPDERALVRFNAVFSESKDTTAKLANAAVLDDSLFNALVQRAFKGEL